MRNLLVLIIVLCGGFYLVGMFVAPTQPAVREWYLASACPQLDKLSPQLCDPIRKAQGEHGDKT